MEQPSSFLRHQSLRTHGGVSDDRHRHGNLLNQQQRPIKDDARRWSLDRLGLQELRRSGYLVDFPYALYFESTLLTSRLPYLPSHAFYPTLGRARLALPFQAACFKCG